MQRFAQSKVGIARGARLLFSAFEDGGPMWRGEGPRVERVTVQFDERFTEPPVVHVSIGMWDMADGANQRGDISADRVTAEGFEIVFRTWGDTRVARIRADWLAIGPVRFEDDFNL